MAACVATACSLPNLFEFKRRPISHLSNRFFPRIRHRRLAFAGTGRAVSDPPSHTSTAANSRIDSPCLVIPPPRNGRKPKAIIKFVGGAFVGAVPEFTYSYLLELLARDGYLIICVPYNVTFDHGRMARQVFERFHSCFDSILASGGLPDSGISAAEIADLPLYSVGHSNGALLQALTGSYFSEKIPKANVIISYNNRPASDAVPYFEQLGFAVGQMLPLLATSPIYSVLQAASGNAWNLLLDTAEIVAPNYNKKSVVSLMTKFAHQLPLVFNELAQGISEFKPTPPENLECLRDSYNIPSTLLVKFDYDTIDETDCLEVTLKPRVESFGGKLEKVVLSGNHITPCVQEPRWEVGNVYTPADAIGQVLKSVSINDTRRLSVVISNWLDCLAY
ncbi:unnamed protein product [Cuscuta campestris]|uniref:Uncharacterized protein n=1 Tax=Cuscuta campestris TaxID=132261 RepID=A0A484KXJ9_9ASTE|nr:unnamed protein product [Cuscuta campestris]